MSTEPVPLHDPFCAMCLEVVKPSSGRSRKPKCTSGSEQNRRINLHFIFRKYIDVERGLDNSSLHQFEPFPFCQGCQSILEQLMEHHQAKEHANLQISSLQAKVFGKIVANPATDQEAAGSDAEDLNYAAGVRAFHSAVTDMFSPRVMVACVPIVSFPDKEEQDTHRNNDITIKETDKGQALSSSSSTCSNNNTSATTSPKFDSDFSPVSGSPTQASSDEEISVSVTDPYDNAKTQEIAEQSSEAIMFSESELDSIDIPPEEMEVVEEIVDNPEMDSCAAD